MFGADAERSEEGGRSEGTAVPDMESGGGKAKARARRVFPESYSMASTSLRSVRIWMYAILANKGQG